MVHKATKSQTPPTRDARIAEVFKQITGYPPYAWQANWARKLTNGKARHVNAPTGCGKTALIACWMASYSVAPQQVPTRICWVIDRRGVVDQTVAEARQWATRMRQLGIDIPVSTLRGEKRDDVALDPTRPAVIVGTTDMIGSRLLMRGYGVSWKQHAPYAGLLTHNTLIALDEAHLSRPFLKLAEQIADRRDVQNLHVISVSASLGKKFIGPALDDPDLEDGLRRRLTATKGLRLSPKAEPVVEALKLADAERRVMVIVRRPVDAQAIARRLKTETGLPVLLVTGQQRTHERMAMQEEELAPWRAEIPIERTSRYLVGTSAIEVGMDITCETLISDWTDAVGIQQRCGRLNRAGTAKDAQLIICGEPGDEEPDDEPKQSRGATERKTRAWLERKRDVSPEHLKDAPSDAIYRDAEWVPLLQEDIALLSCTTKPAPVPRIPVDVLIHGIQPAITPTIDVAVRAELDELDDYVRDGHQHPDRWPSASLEVWRKHYPVRSHETATIPISQMRRWLGGPQAGRGLPDHLNVLEVRYGDPIERTVAELRRNGPRPGSVIVFPSRWMNVDEWGTMSPRDARSEEPPIDVASHQDELSISHPEESKGYCFRVHERGQWWRVYPAAATNDRRSTRQTIAEHHRLTRAAMKRLVHDLALTDADVRRALMEFAASHDTGKARLQWQRWFGTDGEPEPLAHGGTPANPALLAGYRHEVGSVVDTPNLSPLGKALILMHHGRCRPWLSDGAQGDERITAGEQTILNAPVLYASAVSRLGEYGLAWLCCVVAAADVEGTGEKDE